MYSLAGKKALIVGIANENSIAYGCARAFREMGADLAVTYLNEKAKRFVAPVAEELDAEILMPLDVTDDLQMATVFREIGDRWGQLDICLHSIAFCPKEDLHGRVVDCSRAGFLAAMDISVHSFLRMAKLAEPMMPEGGTCMTVSYYGAEKVVDNYGVMGPVKAALESATRYLAAELGRKGISVHALSPGPMPTRAASGIADFQTMMERAEHEAPTGKLASLMDVGAYAAFLASTEAANVTGGVHYIDGGVHVRG